MKTSALVIRTIEVNRHRYMVAKNCLNYLRQTIRKGERKKERNTQRKSETKMNSNNKQTKRRTFSFNHSYFVLLISFFGIFTSVSSSHGRFFAVCADCVCFFTTICVIFYLIELSILVHILCAPFLSFHTFNAMSLASDSMRADKIALYFFIYLFFSVQEKSVLFSVDSCCCFLAGRVFL